VKGEFCFVTNLILFQVADDAADDPFFQALMQLTDTNKKVPTAL